MYRRLAQLFAGIERPAHATVLAISGSERLCSTIGFAPGQLTVANYPQYDLMNLSFADDSFDFIVSDQVLEHLDGNPQSAMDESRRVLKPGGIAVHTTCFLQQIHFGPKDLWRFSPDALRFLARQFSEVIACEGWGNRLMWPYIWMGLRFEGIPEASWHPLHMLATYNEPDWPAVVARK